MTRRRITAIITPTRRRREHRTESEPQARTAERVRAAAPPQQVLALQRQIGNRAVCALLARDPRPTAPPKPPAKEPELQDGIYAIVPGVGTIKLQSAQLGMHRHVTGATGRGTSREGSVPQATEVVVTAELGDHSEKIFRLSLYGGGETVEIRFIKAGKPYMTIKLKNTLVTSYTISGHGGDTHDKPLESWSLNASQVEYETAQQATPASPR